MAFRTNKVPAVEERTVSGSVASFNTALAMPLSSCNIAVNAWQEGSGDPSPSNVRPIHGFSEVNATRCGVNQWNEQTEKGTINIGTGGDVPSIENLRSVGYIRVNPSHSYYINQRTRLFFYDINKTYISYNGYDDARVFTTPSNAYFMRFVITNTYGTTYKNDISINYPSTDTDYHAYTGNTYTIQLGQEVYGAEVDVVNGVAHVNRKLLVLYGTETYIIPNTSYLKSDACDAFFRDLDIYPPVAVSQQNVEICNCLKYEKKYIWNTVGYPNTWCLNEYQVHLNISNTDLGITDVSQETTSSVITKIKAFIASNNLEFTIPIEPFDIQLTPTQIETLIGNNTIFADTGDIDLTYNDLDIAKRGSFREVFKLPS